MDEIELLPKSSDMESNAIKEIYLKSIYLYRELLSNWKFITAFVSIFISIFLVLAIIDKATYTANLTFVVREESGNSMGGLANLLGQFGFGESGSSKYNLDKIVELSHSRRIVQDALFTKISINEKEDFLANHIIDIYGLHKKWSKNKNLANFYFTRNTISDFNEIENSALLRTYNIMAVLSNKDRLINTSFKKSTGILTLSATTINEELSIHLPQILYDKLCAFYIAESTSQSRQTVKNLESRADSIRNLLYSSERFLARTEDRSLGTLLREDRVPAVHLGKNIQILTLIYGETLKNLELATFLLKNNTPFFMEIDMPIGPIKAVKKSKIKAIFIGGIIGFFISSVIILFRRWIKDFISTIH